MHFNRMFYARSNDTAFILVYFVLFCFFQRDLATLLCGFPSVS